MRTGQTGQGRFLHVAEYGGNGSPILLLHGLGAAGSIWEPVARLLAPHHRVLAPDLLGFGRSPWPDVHYTVDDHLAALEGTLEERGLDRVLLDVAGHSMGAVLAAEFAARHPGRVGRLTLIGLPYFQSESDVRSIAARLGLLARLTVGDHWGARAACGLMCALRPLLIFLAPILAPRLPSAVAQDALRHNFTSYSRSLQNVVVRHRLDDTIAALAGRPVLLIHGEMDRVVPVENVRPLAQRFPSFEIKVLPDTGHLLPIEQPALLSRMLTR